MILYSQLDLLVNPKRDTYLQTFLPFQFNTQNCFSSKIIKLIYTVVGYFIQTHYSHQTHAVVYASPR